MGNESKAQERYSVDGVEVTEVEYRFAESRWYTSGDGLDCASGDEYHHGYEVHARAKDAETAEMICAAVNHLRHHRRSADGGLLEDGSAWTRMPTHCESWTCHRGGEKAPLERNQFGFMECTRCRTSWGRG